MERVLLWGHYAVPQFRLYKDWVASWDKFARPEVNPLVGYNSSLWWVDPKKDAALRERRGRAQQ
jgi:ABC-type oligopeptide transport system substrate-binding subunit